MSTPNNLLVAIQVPWMVDLSTPFVSLIVTEAADDGDNYVRFLAMPMAGMLDGPERGFEWQDVRVVESSDKAPTGGGRASYDPCSWVRIQLIGHVASRMLPAFSDSKVLDPSRFTLAAVNNLGYAQDPSGYAKRFRDAWIATGICPDPGVYEVRGSAWLAECGIEEGYAHLVVRGHDVFVEAIASRWSWRFEADG
ncbi:MAG: hypothetical protein GC200_10190 [Tepidisphaera sp.]|nr:hypothetical protein [Tepidisphaera sp.]